MTVFWRSLFGGRGLMWVCTAPTVKPQFTQPTGYELPGNPYDAWYTWRP